MKRENDFTGAEREKFFRKGAELRLPIYLDAELQNQLECIALKKGKDIGELVNQLIRKEMELLEKLS